MDIFFSKTKAPYGCLSNFYHCNFYYDGRLWKSTEHCYQAFKFTDYETQELIRNLPSAWAAADQGRKLPGMRPDWDQVKLQVMESIIFAKTQQVIEVKQALIESGDAFLYELSYKDQFWGTLPDKSGMNWLGVLYMHLRAIIKTLGI